MRFFTPATPPHTSFNDFSLSVTWSFIREKLTLNLHITTVHEGNKPHECYICDVAFSKKGDFNLHQKTAKYQRNATNIEDFAKELWYDLGAD